MPIGYLDLNDEYAIMGQGVAEVDLGDDGILSDDDILTPTYFEGIWEGIDTVADLRVEITTIMAEMGNES